MQPPAPLGTDWKAWGERLNSFLSTTRDKLRSLTSGESAADDGILMWDRETQHVMVSVDSEYQPLSYGYNAFANLYDTTDQIIVAINTEQAITWNTNGGSSYISIGTPTSRIVFDKKGKYHITFSAQVTSTNASSKDIWFFPKVNGVTIPSTSMKMTITRNAATTVFTRSGIFTMNEDDYLEAFWASTDIDIKLDSAPATAFAPSAPSVILTIVEVNSG